MRTTMECFVQNLMRHCYVLFIVNTIFAQSSFAQDHALTVQEGAQLYVNGSWVNVRSRPATNAPVIDHITVNTPLQLKNDTPGNGFCYITYAGEKQGYIDCRYVRSRLFSFDDIGIAYDSSGNPRSSYSASKAFWLQPSAEHLVAAGKYFEATMLKPGEFEAEQKTAMVNGRLTKIRRYPIPEYDAMKSRLNTGVKGFISTNKYDSYQPMPRWETLRTLAAKVPRANEFVMEDESISNLFRIWGQRDAPIELILALKLPVVKKSYFQDSTQLLPPFVTTETASAKFDIPYRAVVKSGPKWIPPGHYNDGYIFGAWDVGAIQTNLVTSVQKYTVHRDGRVRSELTTVPSGLFPDIDADGDVCDIGFAWGDGGAAIYRAVFGTSFSEAKAGNSLFYFFSKDNLPTKARLIKSKSKFLSAGFVSAETFRIDLDRDGVDDIFIWEGTGISKQEIHDPGSAQANYRMVFFNITGEWHLFLVDEFLYGCGC